MFRPQFPLPPAPAGFHWQPCVYSFDSTNTPAFTNIVLPHLAESGHIPLHLDKDACFVLLAIKATIDGFNFLLFDPWSNQLMDDYVSGDLFAPSTVPATVLEGPGIETPPGASYSVRLQGV